MSKTEVGCYLTDGSTHANYRVLYGTHINRTGNVGVFYGYVVFNPAKDLYVANGNSNTKRSIQPKNCQTLTIRNITELANCVGSCHCTFTGNVFANVMIGGDGVLRFVTQGNFSQLGVGAGFFFTLPLAYTTFTN